MVHRATRSGLRRHDQLVRGLAGDVQRVAHGHRCRSAQMAEDPGGQLLGGDHRAGERRWRARGRGAGRRRADQVRGGVGRAVPQPRLVAVAHQVDLFGRGQEQGQVLGLGPIGPYVDLVAARKQCQRVEAARGAIPAPAPAGRLAGPVLQGGEVGEAQVRRPGEAAADLGRLRLGHVRQQLGHRQRRQARRGRRPAQAGHPRRRPHRQHSHRRHTVPGAPPHVLHEPKATAPRRHPV